MSTFTQGQLLLVIAVYVCIILAGSYIGNSEFIGSEGSSYFSQRGNILNQWFVKRGWFWFTVVYWASYLGRQTRSPVKRAIKYYLLATIWWIFFSQWFFGAPLMDRIFSITGGECVIREIPKATQGIADAIIPGTSGLCRKRGGLWVGGHDPSGHVFLLVQSSIVLLLEIIPSVLESRRTGTACGWALGIAYGLLTFWAFMLFVTSLYFHSLTEKLTGLAFAVVEILLVYRTEQESPNIESIQQNETKVGLTKLPASSEQTDSH